jgi:hypothetical protein
MSSDSGPSRRQIPTGQPWFVITSSLRRTCVSFTAATIVFLCGGVLDWFVNRQYLPRISLMLAGAAIALAVGILIFQILTDLQERHTAMQDRLRHIAELNHHIRNALQVIAYHNVPDRSERAIHQVNAEVSRIAATLRQVSIALGDEAGFHAAPTNIASGRYRIQREKF